MSLGNFKCIEWFYCPPQRLIISNLINIFNNANNYNKAQQNLTCPNFSFFAISNVLECFYIWGAPTWRGGRHVRGNYEAGVGSGLAPPRGGRPGSRIPRPEAPCHVFFSWLSSLFFCTSVSFLPRLVFYDMRFCMQGIFLFSILVPNLSDIMSIRIFKNSSIIRSHCTIFPPGTKKYINIFCVEIFIFILWEFFIRFFSFFFMGSWPFFGFFLSVFDSVYPRPQI